MDSKDALSMEIAGEIVLSKKPNETMKKWREIFGLPQIGLAKKLRVTPSVISDYESGRRKSPGINFVKKVVEAILEADEERGSRVIKAYERVSKGGLENEAILDIKEFTSSMRIEDICKIIKGRLVVNKELSKKPIYGYTVIDSLKAILGLSSDEFLQIYGITSERALVFTKVSMGRSPFIAIRVTSIKPGLVVLHGLNTMDKLGVKIAEAEQIPVVLTKIKRVEDLISTLRRNTR